MHRLIAITVVAFLFGCVAGNEATTSAEDPPIVLLGGKNDAWDSLNNPERFRRFLEEDLEYKLDALPLSGVADKQPWPETYWPYFEDSTNARWDGADTLSPLEKYDLVFNDWVPPPGFMSLKPFGPGCNIDSFDLDYYESLGPAARWMSDNRGNLSARDGLDSDQDGVVDECNGFDGIDSWWGLCHAWTPAALIEDEPMRAIEFEGVTFYPSDLKALMITVYDYSRAVVIGGRCKAEQVERDENGRIINPDCRDTNAGTFHVIAANLLGRFHVGFAEDRTYNAQVWNQPVHSFQVDRMEEIDSAQAIRLLGGNANGDAAYPYNESAKRWADVMVSVQYVVESHASRDPTTPVFDNYLRTDRYHYILEMDDEGRIIGGEWINGRSDRENGSFSEQPDFLWYPTGPLPNPSQGIHGPREPKKNPHVSYTKVLRLFNQAAAQN